jgi:hypothetical protein
MAGRGPPAVGVPGCEPDAADILVWCRGGATCDVVELARSRECARLPAMAELDIVPRWIPGMVETPDTAAGLTGFPADVVGVPCGVPLRDSVLVGVLPPRVLLEGVPCCVGVCCAMGGESVLGGIVTCCGVLPPSH